MLRFSQDTQPHPLSMLALLGTAPVAPTTTREDLLADSFVEAFVLLQNDIEFNKKLASTAAFLEQQFTVYLGKKGKRGEDQKEVKDKLAKLKTLLFSFFQNELGSSQAEAEQYISAKGGILPTLSLIKKSCKDSVVGSEALYDTLRTNLADGSTLNSYVLCKCLYGNAAENMKVNHRISESDRQRMDRLTSYSVFAEVLALLEKSLTHEEQQTAREIHIYYNPNTVAGGYNFIVDSELYAFLRGERFIDEGTLISDRQFKRLNKKIENSFNSFNQELLSSAKGQMLQMVKFIDPQMVSRYEQTVIAAMTKGATKFSALDAVLAFYALRDDIKEMKTTLDEMELAVLQTATNAQDMNVLSVRPKARINQNAQDQAFVELINSAAPTEATIVPTAETLPAGEPANVKNDSQDATSAESVKEVAVAGNKAGQEVKAPAIAESTTINRKRTSEERAEIKLKREENKQANIRARSRVIANLDTKRAKTEEPRVHDAISIEVAHIQAHIDLYKELFNRNTTTFTRTQADTLFSALKYQDPNELNNEVTGKIRNKPSSHVTMFLPSRNDGTLRFIGGTSFHGGIAQAESLARLRNAMYSCMTTESAAYLSGEVDVCYVPARSAVLRHGLS